MRFLPVSLLVLSVVISVALAAKIPPVIVTMKNNYSTVNIPNGSPIIVQITGIPSAGYEWLFDSLKGDSVIQNGAPTIKNGAAPGSSSTYYFPFKAIAAGEAILKLVYGRSWEGQPLHTFMTTFNVQ